MMLVRQHFNECLLNTYRVQTLLKLRKTSTLRVLLCVPKSNL